MATEPVEKRPRTNVEWTVDLDNMLRALRLTKTADELAVFLGLPVDAVRKRLIEVEHGTDKYSYYPLRSWSDEERQESVEFIDAGRTDYETLAHRFERTYGAIKTQINYVIAKRTSTQTDAEGDGSDNADLSAGLSAITTLLGDIKTQLCSLDDIGKRLEKLCALWTPEV